MIKQGICSFPYTPPQKVESYEESNWSAVQSSPHEPPIPPKIVSTPIAGEFRSVQLKKIE